MSQFETFIQDELPKRAALETNTSVGYDGDPNLPAAPTALKNAPRGTYYLQSSGVLWFKAIAGTTTWVLSAESGSGGVDTTEEDFTLSLSLTGTDPTIPLRIANQAQADAWGAFRTIGAAIDTIPSFLRHTVTLQLPPGVWDVASPEFYAPDFLRLSRFMLSESAGTGTIKITGDPGWTQLPGTPTMAVQSSSGGTITLQAPHGLAAETYKTYFVLVTSGTGAGQYLSLYDYSGSQLVCAGSFSPALDSSSVVQIVEAATTFNITGASYRLFLRGGGSNSGAFVLFFSHLNFAPLDCVLAIYGLGWYLENGCRFSGVGVYAYESRGYVYAASFDYRGANLIAPIFGQGSYISIYELDVPPCMFQGDFGSTPAPISSSQLIGTPGSIYLVGNHRFQGWSGSYIEGEGQSRIFVQHRNGIYPSSDQLATTAVRVLSGGRVTARAASGLASSTFKGVSSDFDLDGAVKTRWAVLNATSEKSISSPDGSLAEVSEDDPTGIPTPVATLQAFTITMSATGTDPTFPLKLFNQAQATAWGAFKTIKAALAALPDRLAFNVTLQFPTGTWDLSMQEFYDLQRIRVDGNPNRRATGDPSIYLTLAGDNSWLQVPGTPASMAVQSQVGETITLQSDPGLPDDERTGYYLVVLSGTGAGQYKPIRYHSGASFQVAQAYSPTLNATSVVQIATRPTIFNLIDQDDVATDYGYLMLASGKGESSYAAPTVEFRRAEFTTPRVHSKLRFYRASGYLSEGTRVLNKVVLELYSEAAVTFGDVILLSETDSLNYGLLYMSGSSCNTYERYGTVVFFCNRSPGVDRAIWATGSTRPPVVVFQSDVVFQGFTNTYIYISDSGWTNLNNGVGALNYKSDGQADVAVTLRDGARIVHHLNNFSDLLTSSFRGMVSDLLIDGEYVTWEEADAETNNLVVGSHGSMVLFREYY